MAKVSGLIQCLNERFYIQATVESTLQHVDELLVMDNGSQDGTLEYLEEAAEANDQVILIKSDQGEKIHYHHTWDEPGKHNYLIEHASHDWVFLIAADECLPDEADLRHLTTLGDNAWRFRRFAVYPDNKYIKQWHPDWQTRLFNRKSRGGIRYKNIPLHTYPLTRMGSGGPPGAKQAPPSIIHYHHGFGPKKTNLGRGMTLAPLSKDFKHPKAAIEHIFKNPWQSDFNYDMRLYGAARKAMGK